MNSFMPDQETQAHSELASFGEDLRREREVRGISLKEIADATKISKRFLEAIERNDHRTLPAPVFTRGFVREYARYLGLNAEEMVGRYNFAAAGDDRIEKPPQLERVTQPPPDAPKEAPKKRPIPPPYARIGFGVYATVIFIAALAAVVWWAVQHKREIADFRREEPKPVVARRIAPATPAPAPAPLPPAQPEPLKLSIQLIDDCYLDIEVDGKPVMKDDYPQGMRETLEAKNNITFKVIGNAAGVILVLNGKEIPPLGRDGQVVRNRVFDRAYLEKLQ